MQSNKKDKILKFGIFCGIGFLIYRSFFSERAQVEKAENSVMFESYGARNIAEIKDAITETASLYAWGANFIDLYNFLFEIVCAETNFGHAKDTTRESGEGLTQFDKATFNELFQKATAEGKMPREFQNLTYYDLRKNPRFSLFMARYFIFKRIPHKIPKTIAERAKDWKKYYNTIYGKGTEAHYLSAESKWSYLK